MDYKVKHGNTYIPLNSSANKSVITAATQSRKLCGDDTVKITLQSAEYINFAIGDTIDVFGTTYTINQLPTVKRNGERDYEYTLVFEGLQYALIDRVFLMPDNTEGNNLMFDLAGMLDVLEDNINRGNSGKQYKFVLDESLEETEYKNLSLTEKNCLQVLQQLCQEWDTEFTIVEESNQITINIGAAGTVFGVPFTYGRNGGIYNLNREKGATDVITRLFCYGGTQNLTWYRHNRLCLPSKTKNQSYVESAAAQQTYGIKEAVKNFDEIYPNRIGTVSSVSGCEYNEFIDTSMADTQNGGFDLNAKWPNTTAGYTEWRTIKGLEDTTQNRNIYDNDVVGTTRYLINGETAKIHFNTGALAGYEIDIHSYNHTTQKFVLQPLIDENNYDFPSKTNSTFRIAAGDKYVILGINLPESYKTQAENDLEDAAEDYFATVCTPQPKYSLEIDSLALQRIVAGLHSDGDREVFKVGDAVHITDTDTGVDADIRIDRFERDLIDTWKYKLTLTDEVTYTSQVRTLIELNAIKRVVQESGIADPNKIRRGWKDAEELYNMVFDTEGQIYGEKIQPLSIDTTMLKVGARSQQLTLQNVTFQPNYLGDPAKFEASAGYLVHLSIDESGPKTWTMSSLSASSLSTGGLYLYARCSRSGNTGTWVLSNQAITFDRESGWYNFLIGTLGSVDSNTNTRTFSPTYGFSTINGRYITTGVIKSADGQNVVIDLDNGTITGNIKFLSGGQAVDAEQFINNTVDDAVSEIKVSAKNIISTLPHTWEQGSVTSELAGKTYANSKTTSTTRIRTKELLGLKENTDYVVTADTSYYFEVESFKNNSGVSYSGWKNGEYKFNTGTTVNQIAVVIRKENGSATIVPAEIENVLLMVEEGTMPTAYEYSEADAHYIQGGANLINTGGWEQGSCSAVTGNTWEQCKTTSYIRIRTLATIPLETNTYYTLSIADGYMFEIDYFANGLCTGYRGWVTGVFTFNSGDNDGVAFLVAKSDNSAITPIEYTASQLKLEQGQYVSPWESAPYEDIVKNLVATCDTVSTTQTKVIVCPELTAKMMTDSNLRIKVKFANASSSSGALNTKLVFNFKNTAGGTSITPSGATSADVYVWYRNAEAEVTQVPSGGVETMPYWNAGQEVEFTYKNISGNNARVQFIDEEGFDTTSALYKAYSGKTQILGGLMLTDTVICGAGYNQAGMNGLSTNNVAFWAGGSIGSAQAMNTPVVILRDGNAKFGILRIDKGGTIYMDDTEALSRLIITQDAVSNYETSSSNSVSKCPNNATQSGTETLSVGSQQVSVDSNGTYTLFRVSRYLGTTIEKKHNGMLVYITGTVTIQRTITSNNPLYSIQVKCQDRTTNILSRSFMIGEQSYSATVNIEATYWANSTNQGSVDIELVATGFTGSQSDTVQVSGLQVRWYHDVSVAKTVIAGDGLAAIINTSNFFRAIEKTVSGTKVLETTIKGNTDIPGVLWAGRIASGGGVSSTDYNCVGKSVTSQRTATGTYKLTLSGFSASPTVLATIVNTVTSSPKGCSANVQSFSSSQVVIRTFSDNTLTDFEIHVVLFGKN